MKLADLVRPVNEGFVDGFKKGYGEPTSKARPEKKAAPAAASPFSILSNREAKEILYNVLNGKELDYRQKSQLEKIYQKI